VEQTLQGEHVSESVFQILFRATTKAQEGHLPDFIYNALPHVYACAGLLTMVMLRNWFAAFSGVTLISAAGLVWALRYRYRSAFIHSGGHIDIPVSPDENAPGAVLAQIFWQPSFECGHPVIDAQHRRLFGLGNELIKAVSTNKLPGDIEWLLDELVEHISDHFCTEEAVLARTKHPISREHQGIHRSLLSKAAVLRDRHHSDRMLPADLVGFIVYDVITDHITKEDLKFKRVA
jgi:hemerythrin-like metal-binding protein